SAAATAAACSASDRSLVRGPPRSYLPRVVRKVGLAWAAVVALSACGSSGSGPPVDGSGDRFPDGSDAVVTPDAPAEHSGDVPPDASSDVPGDAAAEPVAEAGADGPSQAGDVAPDSPSDTSSDLGSDAPEGGGSDGPVATAYCGRGVDVAGV